MGLGSYTTTLEIKLGPIFVALPFDTRRRRFPSNGTHRGSLFDSLETHAHLALRGRGIVMRNIRQHPKAL